MAMTVVYIHVVFCNEHTGWLVGSLFNDSYSVTTLYSVDDRMINDDELERI
jgi:hypothetical protein